jgi:hypothetical protein
MSVLTDMLDQREQWGRRQRSVVDRHSRARAFFNYLFLAAMAVALFCLRDRICSIITNLTLTT